MSSRRPRTEADTLAATRDWIRNASDELAIKAGARFDPERAQFTCDWIETYPRLYEGEQAGEVFELMPFQREYISRLFGWVIWSEDWGCWVRRFRHGAFWAAKKNGKSPLAAAVNLHLLTADGEFGQKVYQAAMNGQQAKIPQTHAVLMVRQSPELFEECKINGSTLQITHLPSNSYLTILSGDDERGAKANEGLNGSVCFDEMHVVNRQVYERVSRAGISRKEPLLLSYSTSGDDPSSIGYERCQYGRQVNSGERADVHFLHVEYTIPDHITESEIDADPEKYARMANPAWGVLVKRAEFLSDWETSKGNQREMARCLQYRFNKWVGSTNRWLDVRGWERGKEAYTLDDLRGRDCYAAIDLSRTRDLSSVVFTFPEDDEHVRLWPMFWMPETTAKERNHIFPFLSWAQAGYISLTPGDVVDYNRIKADVRKVVTDYDFRVLKLFFDPHYAEELTQQLADGESIGTSAVQGIGGERIQFPQTLMSFTGPSKEFERRVSAGLVSHPGNGVLSWQIGHCECRTDANQNVRPVKPSPNSGKSIDGVIATVMTFADLLNGSGGTFFSPTLLVL